MKILMVVTGLNIKTGTYEVVRNVVHQLIKKHEITILTNDVSVDDIPHTNIIKLQVMPLPFLQYRFMPKLIKMIQNHELDNYDVIHVFEYPLFVTDYITLMKNKIKPPVIISLHGTLNQYGSFPLNLIKNIHNNFMVKFQNHIDLFLVSSLAEKRQVTKFKIPDEKIQILEPAMRLFPIDKIVANRQNILYVGRLSITKNVDLLISAFAKIKTNNVDLIIAGQDFGALTQLKSLVKKLNIENRVFFKGWVSEDEKIELLSRATIFVHPSLEDVFLLSLLEAAAIGIPCVAFDVGSNSEILEDMVTGIIVKKKDPDGLAEKLDLLLSDSKLYEKISANSKTELPKKFNWEKTAKKLEDYYVKVLNCKKSQN